MTYPDNIYKPYPYVFNRGVKTTGIGISGPGGLIFPSYPPIDETMNNSKVNGIPAPPLLLNISVSKELLGINDTFDVIFSCSINEYRLQLNNDLKSVFNGIADVVHTFTNSGLQNMDIDTGEVELGDPVSCIIFAYDGVDDNLPGSLKYQTEETLPFDILTTFSGSVTPDTEMDNRTCVLSFSRLICLITYTFDGVEYNVSNCEWVFSYVSDNDFNITVMTDDESQNIPKLKIKISDIKTLSHPEQIGYISFYLGGLLANQSATINMPVYVDSCESVIGPCWLPHTTFYPLVDVGRTPLETNMMDWLHMEGDDMTYSESTPGYGIIKRTASELPPEKLVSNIGQLLNYPFKEYQRGYESFQPDYIDTRIIQDCCIYPVSGKYDNEQIDSFYETYTRVTRKF